MGLAVVATLERVHALPAGGDFHEVDGGSDCIERRVAFFDEAVPDGGGEAEVVSDGGGDGGMVMAEGEDSGTAGQSMKTLPSTSVT